MHVGIADQIPSFKHVKVSLPFNANNGLQAYFTVAPNDKLLADAAIKPFVKGGGGPHDVTVHNSNVNSAKKVIPNQYKPLHVGILDQRPLGKQVIVSLPCKAYGGLQAYVTQAPTEVLPVDALT